MRATDSVTVISQVEVRLSGVENRPGGDAHALAVVWPAQATFHAAVLDYALLQSRVQWWFRVRKSAVFLLSASRVVGEVASHRRRSAKQC